MSKRIICILLSAILMLCPMSFGVYGAENTENSQLKLMEGLDIVCGLDEAKLENYIPKSTFINYILNIAGENKYADYYNQDVLREAEIMGIISSASTISQKETLSAYDAITIAVRILGYDMMAQDNGGYPEGYVKAATKLGLLKEVNLGEKVTYNQAIALLARVIKCDYSGYAENQLGDVISYEWNVNVLRHYRGIYSVRAVITADSKSDLYGDIELKEGLIKIGEEICYAGDSNARELLGHYAEIYMKKGKNEMAEVVYADDKAKQVFVLDAKNIEAVKNNIGTIEYYKDDTSTRLSEIQIAADAAIAFNGVSYPQCNETDFMIDGTTITLVENNGDRKYDYVHLEYYDTMIVSAVSVSSMKIYNEYTFDENTRILDLSKYDKDKIHIFKDNAQIDISDISKGDVLSIFRTPKDTDGEIKIYAETGRFDGTVEQYSAKNKANKEVVIDGKVYELSKLYIDANLKNEKIAKTLNIGKSYTFGCDKNGKIVFVKEIQSDELMYGYAVKMIEMTEGFDDEVAIKMFMDDGSWKEYTFADKVKWNGSEVLEAEDIHTNGEINECIPGLIGIKLNSGDRINVLETPVAYEKDMNRARLNTIGEIDAYYRYNGTTFANDYYMTSQTKVFIVPDDPDVNESFYAMGTNTSFQSDKDYTDDSVIGYNSDEYYTLDMVVSKRSTDNIRKVNDTLYMVKEVGTMYDDMHGIVPYVNVASNTYAGVSLCGEDGVFDGIKEGDLIKMHMNSIGLIDNCSVIYSVSDGVQKVLPTVSERHSASSVVKGVVTEIDVEGERILIETTKEMAFMVPASTPVLIYDLVGDTVTVGNLSEIEKDDFINVSLSRSLVNMLAIYKGF